MPPTADPGTPHDHRGHVEGPAPVAQWVGLLLAPAAFALHGQGAYLLVLRGCGRPSGFWLVHLAGAVAVLLAALGTATAVVAWRRAAHASEEREASTRRTRLLGFTGVWMSAVLTLLLAAQWIESFVIPPCE